MSKQDANLFRLMEIKHLSILMIPVYQNMEIMKRIKPGMVEKQIHFWLVWKANMIIARRTGNIGFTTEILRIGTYSVASSRRIRQGVH